MLTCAAEMNIRVWRSLVSRLNGVQEAAGSNPVTRTMQSVLIGSEYPVMGTLLFSFAVVRQISIDTFLKVPLLLLVTLFQLQLLYRYIL